MRVLITGGCGFVGRHFIKKLQLMASEIIVVDNFIEGGGSLPLQKWYFQPNNIVQIINKDCREYFKESNGDFDLVIHLAAVVGGRLTIERNPLAVADDLAIDANFWKWAITNNPGHIISFSSSAAYPVNLQNEAPRNLLEEDIDFDNSLGIPDLTYGWAKLTSEYIGRLAARMYGLKVASYRPFSGYGADQSLSYPFPSICLRAIENIGSELFEVWGSGLQRRDFIHIDDIVDAVLQTYPSIIDGTSINLSSGNGTSFIELASLACNQLGYDPLVRGQIEMPEGVFSRIGDNSKLKKLGWRQSITLQEGIAECIQYLQTQNIQKQ
jgi:GDP-L-fucose synthase